MLTLISSNQETVLFIGASTQRLLLGAEMLEMKKLDKDNRHREFTVLELTNFRGGGKWCRSLNSEQDDFHAYFLISQLNPMM